MSYYLKYSIMNLPSSDEGNLSGGVLHNQAQPHDCDNFPYGHLPEPGEFDSVCNDTYRIRTYILYASPESISAQVFGIMVIMIAAVFGNSLMCYAVYRTPTLRTMANLFTINLSLTDLSVAIVVLPVWTSALVSGSTRPTADPPFPECVCQATAFFTVLFLLVSIATLAGISLDRYFIICHPLRYPMEITSRRIYSVLSYIWLQSTLLAATPLLGWGEYTFRPQTIPICNPSWQASTGHAIFLSLFGMAMPFGIMIVSYTRIFQAARKQWKRIAEIQLQLIKPSIYTSSSDEEDLETKVVGRTRSSSRSSIFHRLISRQGSTSSVGSSYSSIAKNLRTLRTIFIVVGVFFICWGPYVVVQFWAANNADKPLPYPVDFLTTMLAFSNGAINPFMFMLLNRDFRFALRLMVARIMQLMGEEEAVHKVKIAGHRDSMVESIRLHSRGSFDSGVDVDSLQNQRLIYDRENARRDSVTLKPPPSPLALGVKAPESEVSNVRSGETSKTTGSALRTKTEGATSETWLLDTPVPQSYRACGETSNSLQPLSPGARAQRYEDVIRQSLRRKVPDGPTFIVPNGNIPIIVIGGDGT